MSSALKQVIVNAIIKIAGQNPAREIEGEPSAEEARDEFIRLLIAELFPESPAVPVTKEKKKPGPKPKLDETGEPIKKPRSPMTEEAKAAMVAKRKATMEANKAAKKAAEPATPETAEAAPKTPPKAPKKAPKPSGTANLDKFTPTQTKKIKEIVGATADKKAVLVYLNGLSNVAFHDKTLEDHLREYAASLAPPPEPETQQEEVSLVETDFEGATYYINPETKRVYTMDEIGTHPVGYVGMAKFETMEMPTEDDD